MKDFFISYNKADESWAEWIAWILEERVYSVEIQAWDFRPGGNFILKMQEAAANTRKTIAVLSQSYLDAAYTQPEWAAALVRDPEGEQRTLIPIRVKDCNPEGLLASIIYIDIVGHSEQEAIEAIIEGLKERAKPDDAPGFPGLNEPGNRLAEERVAPNPVEFPGTADTHNSTGAQESEIPWNVPPGVRFFTGREDILKQLHETLIANKTTALAQRQAISGLGGIGKTQTAIEYAKRHRAEYRAVLWAVAESRESLISDFIAIANTLNLPEKNIQDQNLIVSAVRRWLEANGDWLLILDNADEPRLVEEFLPAPSEGHILITSRAQVFDNIGILNPIEMEEMSPEDAKEFLLRRTGRNNLEADEAKAIEQLAHELDYLPLALEQAGAYIKELRSSFQDYLTSYRKRGIELLEKVTEVGQYRKSVRTTWSLNFQQVEQASKASADLLRVSAFLSPDRIPYELVQVGSIDLGPELSAALNNVGSDPLAFDETLKPLIQYSLIHRDRKTKTYDIHRLVQAVLKDAMDEATKPVWAERVVNAVARVVPKIDLINFSLWNDMERVVAHAQAGCELIEKWGLKSVEAAQLLNDTGRYLHLRARLHEAELFYTKSLKIREELLGPDYPDVATSLHNLAWLHFDEGKYMEAEPLYLRSLAIREESLDSNHLDISNTLLNLAQLYTKMGKYVEAEGLLAKSLEIKEKALGVDHYEIADILLEQANINYRQSKYSEAESLLVRALEITESQLGSEHHEIGYALNSLAMIYYEHKKLAEAEALYLRSISVIEKAYGTNYPTLGNILGNLGRLYIDMDRYAEAESLFVKSIDVIEKALGQGHPNIAHILDHLIVLYRRQSRYAEIEELCMRSLNIREKRLGPQHELVAESLYNLAQFYSSQNKQYKGEPLIRRALTILKNKFGREHPGVAAAMFLQSDILKRMNRKGEAQKIEAQAIKIQNKQKKNKRK